MRDSMDLMIQCLEILKEDSTRRGLERFLRTAARGLKLPALAIHLKQGERRRQLSCRTAGSRAVRFVFRLPLESRGVTFGTLVVGCNSLFQNLRVQKVVVLWPFCSRQSSVTGEEKRACGVRRMPMRF